MEKGSASNSSSHDSLNGLKFGQKIYFEDAGQVKHGGSGSGVAVGAGRPPPAPATAKKGRTGVVQGGQPPRCQVEDCKVDLSDAKTYYSRHKVCGMHSKSPKVIVAGLEQRFCQQCSRFHQLPEFDQGKRSCRRRLAGHNERRRKPPPGTLLSARYGSLSSPLFESNNRAGSFLMDFSTYPTLTWRDSLPNTRMSEQALGNQNTAMGKFPPHAWQSSPENPQPEPLLQGSASRTTYLGSSIPSGECFAGVSDSSRALSLLSTQSWGSRDRSSSLRVNGLANASGTPVVQSPGSPGEAINDFSSPLWVFKGSANNSSSHEMSPDLGLGQISQPASSHYSGNLDVAQQNGREYLGLEHSRGYDSSIHNIHWSL